MAASLAIMLPAMNNDDRTELLGGMQAGAPPEVFAGVWSLAGPSSRPATSRSSPGAWRSDAPARPTLTSPALESRPWS